MKKLYYHIKSFACDGKYYRQDDQRILEFFNDYIEQDFFSVDGGLGGYFISSELKVALEAIEIDLKVSFDSISQLLFLPHLEKAKEKFSVDDFWKINIGTNKDSDIFLWEDRFLVVSNICLKILMKNNGFEDLHSGGIYGKEYEVLTNRYLISSDFEEYFNNQYWKDSNIVKDKLRVAANIGRGLKGLSPLG